MQVLGKNVSYILYFWLVNVVLNYNRIQLYSFSGYGCIFSSLPTQPILQFYWRPVRSDKEGNIYHILVEDKMPHIVTFEKGNDVAGNTTITDQLRTEIWACDTSGLRHYRMSLAII